MFKLACLAAATQARMSWGSCPDDVYMTDLDMASYSGTWYSIASDPIFPYTMMTQCVYKKYTEDSNGDYDLHFGGYYPMMFQYGGVGGKVYCDGPDCEATMTGSDKRDEFRILATDYSTFDIGYVCMDMIDDVMMADFVIIGSRDNKEFSAETKATIEEIINTKLPDYKFSWNKMKNYKHTDCEYPDKQFEW